MVYSGTSSSPASRASVAADRASYAPTLDAEAALLSASRLLLIDDHGQMRRLMQEFLSDDPYVRIVGDTASGATALALVRELQPDLVVLDVRLPDINAIALTRHLLEAVPGVRVVLVGNSNDDLICEAVCAGAVGFLARDLQPAAMLRALRGVAAGEVALSRRMVARVMAHFRQHGARGTVPPPSTMLTGREIEVLHLLAQGASDRQIAARLVIAESTAKKHVQHILRKLRARNRVEAVAKYRSFRSS